MRLAQGRGISRREFLRGAAVGTGLLMAAGSGLVVSGRAVARRGSRRRRTRALFVPPTIDLAGLEGAFGLTAAPSTIYLVPQGPSNAWTYNGLMPGPTFLAHQGDIARITLSNQLPQETITHWHGMVVDHENDGHPLKAIAPGGTYDYEFPVNQRAAFNWYHPHPHMLTGQQVALGLAGAFLVRDQEEEALGLPDGGHAVPLVVRDADVDPSGNLEYKPRSGGFLGNFSLVNGKRFPLLIVDTSVYRFRVLNGANARIFRLALSNGEPFTLIGNDGGLLANAVQIAQIDISPGERLDLLVDFGRVGVGGRVILRDLLAGWDLIEFNAAYEGSPATIPTALSTITPLSNPVRTRDFSFDAMSKINGLEYDINRIDFQVPFGQTELWRFQTAGNAPHPVHVHGASFQVVSRSGGRGQLFPWEAGWKDTVLLEDGETVEILIRFEGYRGLYLIHCHKLEHEDLGMMSNFEVV